MKAIIFVLLTTQIEFSQGHRFVANMDQEQNDSESVMAASALKESEKQLGLKMGTPMFTERAKRVENSHAVDYMGAHEFQNFQREEREEAQETADSLAEAQKEIKDKERAEAKRQHEIAELEAKQAQLRKIEQEKQQSKDEWKKAQEEVQQEAEESYLQTRW